MLSFPKLNKSNINAILTTSDRIKKPKTLVERNVKHIQNWCFHGAYVHFINEIKKNQIYYGVVVDFLFVYVQKFSPKSVQIKISQGWPTFLR